MKNLSQKRASFALSKVQEILNDKRYKNLNNKNFKSFIAGAPSMILQNGFGQTLAFWASKAKQNNETKEGFTLEAIREWFNSEENPLKLRIEVIDIKAFIEYLVKLEQREFLQYQKEALLMLEWFKRFANAFLSEENKSESND